MLQKDYFPNNHGDIHRYIHYNVHAEGFKIKIITDVFYEITKIHGYEKKMKTRILRYGAFVYSTHTCKQYYTTDSRSCIIQYCNTLTQHVCICTALPSLPVRNEIRLPVCQLHRFRSKDVHLPFRVPGGLPKLGQVLQQVMATSRCACYVF